MAESHSPSGRSRTRTDDRLITNGLCWTTGGNSRRRNPKEIEDSWEAEPLESTSGRSQLSAERGPDVLSGLTKTNTPRAKTPPTSNASSESGKIAASAAGFVRVDPIFPLMLSTLLSIPALRIFQPSHFQGFADLVGRSQAGADGLSPRRGQPCGGTASAALTS